MSEWGLPLSGFKCRAHDVLTRELGKGLAWDGRDVCGTGHNQ
jgi:hypothetical protein